MSTKRFRIAFSFAGEKRPFVKEVADLLARQFGERNILYDKFHKAEFSQPDLAFDLLDLYRDEADLIVVVFCKDYDKKEWCGLEWRAIYSIIKEGRKKQVMLTRFDKVDGKDKEFYTHPASACAPVLKTDISRGLHSLQHIVGLEQEGAKPREACCTRQADHGVAVPHIPSTPPASSEIAEQWNPIIAVPTERFLDSLDSTRFASNAVYFNSRLYRQLYVKAQIVMSLIAGDGIIITENQLFDSLGFLETFAELYPASQQLGCPQDLPMRLALRSKHSNVFEMVASILANPRYVLSLWEDLSNSQKRRQAWADALRMHVKPADHLVFFSERPMFEHLWQALHYFGPERCVVAQEVPKMFEELIESATMLTDSDVDGLADQAANEVDGSPLQAYFHSREECEAAKKIIGFLSGLRREPKRPITRSSIREALDNQTGRELREGVWALTDSIYNQVLGLASGAGLLQSSTFPVRNEAYARAGFALATYLRERREDRPGSRYNPWDIFAYDALDIASTDEHEDSRQFLATALEDLLQAVPWGALLKMQQHPEWGGRISDLRQRVTLLCRADKALAHPQRQADRNGLERDMLTRRNELETFWAAHIDFVRRLVQQDRWEIRPHEIQFHHCHSPRFPLSLKYQFCTTKRHMTRNLPWSYSNWQDQFRLRGRLDQRPESARGASHAGVT